MPTALLEAVSDKAWSGFSQSDYTPQAWRSACLIHKVAGSDNKTDHSLPVREPGGALNRNAVHAAAGRLGQVDTPADTKRAAARKLVGLYRSQLKEDPPAGLLTAAGMAAESAQPERAALHEQVTLAEATRGQPTGRRMRVQLITPGWGSSGYYSEAVLKQAAADRVFPAGTSMYVDHQTLSEATDRVHGERSLKDLAARFATDATWDGHALVADVESFGPWRPVLADMADHVGVSIRSFGRAEMGEAEGRTGPIITSIDHAQSVDFVAEAGRGGKVLALLESDRTDLAEARNIGAWMEARIHQSFTCLADDSYGDGRLTREERLTLSAAIGDALTAFTARVEAEQPQLYQRDLWDEPGPMAADVTEAHRNSTPPKEGIPRMSGTSTQGTPAPEGGGAPNDDTGANPAVDAPDTEASEATDAELAEARRQLAEVRQQLAQIGENAQRTTTAERQLAESRAENARLRAEQVARTRTADALAESGLPEAAWPRVSAVVCGSVPLTEAGTVDDARLSAAIAAAIDAERTYIATLAESAGTGIPRGLGASADTPDPKQLDDDLTRSLRDIGLSESAAKIAVTGRG